MVTQNHPIVLNKLQIKIQRCINNACRALGHKKIKKRFQFPRRYNYWLGRAAHYASQYQKLNKK